MKTFTQTLMTDDGQTFRGTSDHAITADELREWLEHVAGEMDQLTEMDNDGRVHDITARMRADLRR